MDFTGSDWCGWCILLDREVFSKPEFKEYANKNLILVEVDFPRKRDTAEPEKQNEQLAREYQVEGFPTIVVLNGDGKIVGSWATLPGGPAAFIAELEQAAERLTLRCDAQLSSTLLAFERPLQRIGQLRRVNGFGSAPRNP